MEKDKNIILAFNSDLGEVFNVLDGLPKNPENFTWMCVNCKRRVHYVENIGYFRHKGDKSCDFEPETIEHKTMKQYWYDIFPKFNLINSRKLEYRIGDQIIDVYFKLRNGKKIAIECQNSQISAKKLIDRTKNYTMKDIYVLWIFNGYGSFVSDKKNPLNEDNVSVIGVERRVHRLYGGRVYYMNVLGDKILNPPYALHFAPFFKHKTTDFNYFGYDKYYKDKRSIVCGTIPNFKIVWDVYNGFKLARFMDKSESSLCVDQILDHIKKICRDKSRVKRIKNGTLIIPFDSIISNVEERFGYFLPHLLIKKSRKIKKLGIEKVVDNKWHIHECITIKISDYL